MLAAERMVTLPGADAGGIGKSRLSLQAAEAMAPAYADGAWLTELAAVSEPTSVGHAVAGALGVALQPGKTIKQSLPEALSRRHGCWCWTTAST